MQALWGYAQLLAVPLGLFAIILIVAWRQDRRRRWARRRPTGLRKARWGPGSASRAFGSPEHTPKTSSGTGPGQGPHDRPTYLD